MDKKISIVVPCYNEQECAPIFMQEVLEQTKCIDAQIEVIFVDDGSSDDTLNVIRSLSNEYTQANYIALSRNFGKEAALLAGLEAATGNFVVVMDADLQHPPALLPQMYEALTTQGYDSACARRVDRIGESRMRSFFARRFYRTLSKMSNMHMQQGATDYRMMTRQFVNAVLSLSERNRFTKGIFGWVGFNTKWIEYKNAPRAAGKTKWSFWKLWLYSMDGIISFSAKPLAISSFFGILFCLASFIFAIVIAIGWLLHGNPVQGWASTITIILFASGIQLFSIGILGQYVAKSYLETKGRPIYIIKENSKLDESLQNNSKEN